MMYRYNIIAGVFLLSFFGAANAHEGSDLSMSEHEMIQRGINYCSEVYREADKEGRHATVYEADRENIEKLKVLHADLMREKLSDNDMESVISEGLYQGMYLTIVMEMSIERNIHTMDEHVRKCRSSVEDFILKYF